MRLPDFEYVEPKSLEEACLFLREHAQESRILAGGTDLLPSMKQRIVQPAHVVSLGSIPGLDSLGFDERSGLQIGGAVKLRSLERDRVILEKYPALAKAAGEVGSVQLREMGTAGGNINIDTRCYYYNQSDFWRSCRPTCIKIGGETCNAMGGGRKCFAVFSGDLAPMLIALGATIELVSARGERTLLLKDYYTGDGARPFTREPEEVLVRIDVPPLPKETHSCYLKYRIRRSIDFPLAAVATVIRLDGHEKVVREARVVIGAVGTKPQEVESIGELLIGKSLTDALLEDASQLAFTAAKPVPNTASSFSYRKKMIKVMVKKALLQALDA
jgi:4-hydroxybenzoyl-CoA reductase subunit beta